MEEQMDVDTERLAADLEALGTWLGKGWRGNTARQAATTITTQAARIKELEAGLAKLRSDACEGANDLDDPITPSWDCSLDNLAIITRNVQRFADMYEVADALIPGGAG